MSGAVQSGYRAAAEILQDLQSTALKAEDLSLIEKTHPPATSWYVGAIANYVFILNPHNNRPLFIFFLYIE